MSNVLRIIDANANRARETLRVMEEAARFILNDAALSAAIKQLRHDFAAALSALPHLEAHRDTPGDVGTTISTDAEATRGSVADVAVAAGKRLSEALRAIEEYSKTLPAPEGSALPLPVAIESLRYRGYEIEKRLNAALAHGRAKQWRLCLLLTESLCRLPWREVLEQSLEAGVDCVQLREKDLEANELLDRAAFVVERCHAVSGAGSGAGSGGGYGVNSGGVTAIINDRPDIAYLSGADGVHLGQTDLSPQAVRKLVGHQLLIGVSTSNLAEAHAAKAAGADYVGVGPMFPTTTKHKPVLAGPAYLRDYFADEQLRDLPNLAIGGITPDNLPELTAVGVRGIAVSSIICAAEAPSAIAKQLLQNWED